MHGSQIIISRNFQCVLDFVYVSAHTLRAVVLATSLSTGGLHNLSAKYSGDSNYAAASASIPVQALYPTVATVSLNPSSIVYGNSVTITSPLSAILKRAAVFSWPMCSIMIVS